MTGCDGVHFTQKPMSCSGLPEHGSVPRQAPESFRVTLRILVDLVHCLLQNPSCALGVPAERLNLGQDARSKQVITLLGLRSGGLELTQKYQPLEPNIGRVEAECIRGHTWSCGFDSYRLRPNDTSMGARDSMGIS